MTMHSKSSKPTFTLDIEKYQHFLDNSDASDAEKQQLLEALWGLITEFVTMGFQVNSVQQVLEEQENSESGEAASTSSDKAMLSSDDLPRQDR